MTTTSSIARKANSSIYFDLMHPKWTDESFVPWKKDHDMLQQLLYRNNHQHGPTLIHRFMKRMLRESELFVNEARWQILKRSLIESNAITSSSNISTNIVQKLIAQRKVLVTYITETTKVINCIVKAGRAVVQGLQRRTFATLYSAWIAFVGSFYQFFKHILLQTLLPAINSTDAKIRIAAGLSKQSLLLISALNNSFPPVAKQVLNQLQLDSTIDMLASNENNIKLNDAVGNSIYLSGCSHIGVKEVVESEPEIPELDKISAISETDGDKKIKKRSSTNDVSEIPSKKMRKLGEDMSKQVTINNNNDDDSIEDIFSSSSSKNIKKMKKKNFKKAKKSAHRETDNNFAFSANDDDIDNIFFSFSKSLSK